MDARLFYRSAFMALAYSESREGFSARQAAARLKLLLAEFEETYDIPADERVRSIVGVRAVLTSLVEANFLDSDSAGRYRITERGVRAFARVTTARKQPVVHAMVVRDVAAHPALDVGRIRSLAYADADAGGGNFVRKEVVKLTRPSGSDVGAKHFSDFERAIRYDQVERDLSLGSEKAVGAPLPEIQPTTASAGGAAPPEPASVTAYARIEIASDLRCGDETPLVVGIAALPQPNVDGKALTFAGGYPFDLTITVVAQDLTLKSGEAWSNTLQVTSDDKYPSITLHVIADAVHDAPVTRLIAVLYSSKAQTIGYGAVKVTVHPPDADVNATTSSAAGAVVTTYPAEPAFDLTIRINDPGDRSGRFKWTFESPHFTVPGEPVEKSIAGAPEDFAKDLIAAIDGAQPAMVEKRIRSRSGDIADAMPDVFTSLWQQLRDTMPDAGPPSVLIVSEDPFVPWELAAVKPLFDSAAPGMLGAQADVGRWIFDPRHELTLPPPADFQLKPMVEVTAVYAGSTTPRLQHAEEEGATLNELYGAEHVDATNVAITECFHDGKPPAATIHIALHGEYDAQSPGDGLIMADAVRLTADDIAGGTAVDMPFVFLNACQVGSGKQTLGTHTGMPAAFVRAKARGVIAPLWSVNDDIAKQFALRFYAGLAGGTTSPAALLREERKLFAQPATRSATSVAYLFFGNPRLRKV